MMLAALLLLGLPGPAAQLDCGPRGPHRFTARAWETPCALAEPAPPKAKPISHTTNISCARHDNIITAVTTRLDVSLVRCDYDPRPGGVNNHSCASTHGLDTTTVGGFPNGTRGQPLGHRVLRVYSEDRRAMMRDLLRLDAIGPPPGASACSNASYGSCTAKPGDPCPFNGIWFERSTAALAERMANYVQAFKELAGSEGLDEIVQDSEMGESAWSAAIAGKHTPLACAAERWAAIQADARWPSDLAALTSRGWIADTSQPDYLFRAMGVTNTSAYTRNQLIFNEYLEERWAALWTRALFAPARAAFPHLQESNYAFTRHAAALCPHAQFGDYCRWGGTVVGNVRSPAQ